MKIETLFVDMDGVLFDFNKRYLELYDMLPSEADDLGLFSAHFTDFIKTGQFANLELLPDALGGLDFLLKAPLLVQILSSTGRKETFDAVSQQKKVCLEYYGIPFEPIFVPGKYHKKKYARKAAILVDDVDIVIEEWNKKGGVGILHTHWSDTINKLKLCM